VRRILRGPCKGLRYRIFPGYGLSPLHGGWEREAQALMVKYIEPSAVVYDVGANFGIHALLMARLAPRGHVYAFEPLPEIMHALEENVRLNGFENVTCVPVALSDRAGTAEFVRGHHGGAGHLKSANPAEGELSRVETTTLDAFVYTAGNPAPNFLKVDVEGAESQVLTGASKVLDEARPVVLLDLHTPEQDVAVGKILLDANYEAFRTEDGQRIQHLDRGWPDPTGIWGQFIALPRGSRIR
jgi:FkbM family methyltransferase